MFEIDFPWESRIYCPRCGVNNIPGMADMEEAGQRDVEKLIKDCAHLKFYGSWDSDGYVIDKENLTQKFNSLSEEEREKLEDGQNIDFQNFLLKNLNDGYVQFCQIIPMPAGMGGFAIYDLSAGLEDQED